MFFTALFITVFILSQVFDSKNLELVSLNKLVLSQATADGILIKGRVGLFYNAIFAGTGILLIGLIVLSYSFLKLKINDIQHRSILLLSIVGTSIVFVGLIGVNTQALIHFIFLILLYKIIVYGLGNSDVRHLKPFKTDILSNSIIALSFFVYFADLVLSGTESLILTYSIALLIFTLLFIGFKKYKQINSRRFIQYAIPFSFVTIVSFITVEAVILSYLKGKDFIDYKTLFLIISLSTYLLFCIPIVFKRVKSLNASKIFKFILAPSILFGFTLLLQYFPIVNQNTEMFELANPANALMKIFQQHEIPFVDFISSHMFSEQWYGIIYSAIFGYNSSLDFQIYLFFNFYIYLLVVYFTLNKVLQKPAYSLFFIVSFPFLAYVFSSHLLITFIPFVLLYKSFEKQTVKNYLGYFALLVGLCVWRLDVGYAAIFSSVFYFLIVAIFTKPSIHWKSIFKSILILTSIIVVLFILAVILRDFNYLVDHIQIALHYFSGDQAHGTSSIAGAYPHQFFIIHFLIPFLSVLLIAYIIYLLVKEEFVRSKQDNFILHSSLFLFIVSLANAQRGLVRHGFLESNDIMMNITFHLALSILLLYLFRNYAAKWKTSLFYVSIFMLFILLKFFPFTPEFSMFDKAVEKNAFLDLKSELSAKTKLIRTKGDADFYSQNITDFKNFLDQNLKKDETFLDFSNTPMLYYYTNRKSLGYFCQNLQNTVDDFLQLSYIKNLKTNKVPITVFSSSPASWFDNTDGIPNVMRYYLISEHIYKNYKPYAIISNKRIWMEKDYEISNQKDIQVDTLANQVEVYDYKKTAFYIFDFYKKNNFKDLIKVQELNQINEQAISTENLKDYPHHAYLLIEFETESQDKLITFSARDSADKELDIFKFELLDSKDKSYMLRISNSYHWQNSTVKSLQFGNYSGSPLPKIKKVTLLKDIRNED